MAGVSENSNGVYADVTEDKQYKKDTEITLYTIFNDLISAIFFPNSDSAYESASLLRRIKIALSRNIPLFPVAAKNTAHRVILWTRRGSPLRALLVVSVGTIALLALSGFLVFLAFFAAATINAIVISLLMSLAAAGGFLAIFFAFLTAIYIVALSVAVFVISATTISAIIAALITTGWIGFFWTIWLATQMVLGLAKQSLGMTGSVVSAYSSARLTRRRREPNKLVD